MKKNNKIRNYFLLNKISPVVRFLTISDFLIISGFGLVSPIFAIYVVGSIQGGTIEVVGFSTTIYLLSKSLFQIPAAYFIDKIKGEKDDFWFMFVGSVIFSIIPLFYIIAKNPMHLYIIQFFYGVATAVTFPSWYAIFTRHIDKDREGMEWGIYNTLVDLGGAGTAAIGGLVASMLGFDLLFLIVFVISLIGSLFLLFLYQDMKIGKILIKKNDKQK